MCQTLKDPTIKVAEADIIVYKSLCYRKVNIIERLFRPSLLNPKSHIQNFTYRKGVSQPNVPLKIIKYTTDEWYVEAGYHSYVNQENGCNAKFIIPKGTKYTFGHNNGNAYMPTYVSETIIYVGKLN